MTDGGELHTLVELKYVSVYAELTAGRSIAYMVNSDSIQFNIVSKNLGCERMAFFLNEAACDIRDMMYAATESKAKL